MDTERLAARCPGPSAARLQSEKSEEIQNPEKMNSWVRKITYPHKGKVLAFSIFLKKPLNEFRKPSEGPAKSLQKAFRNLQKNIQTVFKNGSKPLKKHSNTLKNL
jgi:hypothetical protein